MSWDELENLNSAEYEPFEIRTVYCNTCTKLSLLKEKFLTGDLKETMIFAKFIFL